MKAKAAPKITLPPPAPRRKVESRKVLLTLHKPLYARLEALAKARGEAVAVTARALVSAGLDALGR